MIVPPSEMKVGRCEKIIIIKFLELERCAEPTKISQTTQDGRKSSHPASLFTTENNNPF